MVRIRADVTVCGCVCCFGSLILRFRHVFPRSEFSALSVSPRTQRRQRCHHVFQHCDNGAQWHWWAKNQMEKCQCHMYENFYTNDQLVALDDTPRNTYFGGTVHFPLESKHPHISVPILQLHEVKFTFGRLLSCVLQPWDDGNLQPVKISFDSNVTQQELTFLVELAFKAPFYREHHWQDGQYLLADNWGQVGYCARKESSSAQQQKHAQLHGRTALTSSEADRELWRIHIM